MTASIIARYDGRRATAAISFRFCRFSSVEDFRILGSPAHTVKAITCYAHRVVRYRLMPHQPGDLVSSNADAFLGGATPIGPYIADCDFSYMEDDGININSRCTESSRIDPDGKANAPSCEGADGVWILDLESDMIEGNTFVGEARFPQSLGMRNCWQVTVKNNAFILPNPRAKALCLDLFSQVKIRRIERAASESEFEKRIEEISKGSIVRADKVKIEDRPHSSCGATTQT
jgi:hypothetical protein